MLLFQIRFNVVDYFIEKRRVTVFSLIVVA